MKASEKAKAAYAMENMTVLSVLQRQDCDSDCSNRLCMATLAFSGYYLVEYTCLIVFS